MIWSENDKVSCLHYISYPSYVQILCLPKAKEQPLKYKSNHIPCWIGGVLIQCLKKNKNNASSLSILCFVNR